jgi:hypothetical protein
MWLTSPGTGIANSMRAVGDSGRRATNHVATPTTIAATTKGIAARHEIFRGAALAFVKPLASVQDSALSANDRSRADWKR